MPHFGQATDLIKRTGPRLSRTVNENTLRELVDPWEVMDRSRQIGDARELEQMIRSNAATPELAEQQLTLASYVKRELGVTDLEILAHLKAQGIRPRLSEYLNTY